MAKLTFGTNTAVFILFFGLALPEAFHELNWLKAGLWISIGIVFLLADSLKAKPRSNVKEIIQPLNKL